MKTDLEKTAQAKRSQSKGSSFEVKVCKQVVNYFNMLGIEGMVFNNKDDLYRTEGSGSGYHEKGDIIIPNPLLATLFPFFIECKAIEGWDFEQLTRYDSNEGDIKDWFFVEVLRKSKLQSSRDRTSIVIFTKKNSRAYVLFYFDEIRNFLNEQMFEDKFYIHFMNNELRSLEIRTLEGFLNMVAPRSLVKQTYQRFQALQEH